MNQYLKTLEFDYIIEKLKEHTVSEAAGTYADALEPLRDIVVCNNKIRESAEAKEIIETIGTPPTGSADALKRALERAEIGDMLLPDQFEQILFFLNSARRMKQYLKRSEYLNLGISYMGMAFHDLGELEELISVSIRNGDVDSMATPRLRSIDEKLERKREQIREKLEKIMSSRKSCFTDSYIVQRDGHYVLPVKKESKSQVAGTVYDVSSSGSTVFIEPQAVSKLQQEADVLDIERDNEVRRILYELTDMVCQKETELRHNALLMEELDFIFAKGKLALDMNATAAEVKDDGTIRIIQGRHPRLDQQECVPLDFETGGEYRGIIITGPNTGGKTVALKTVGLLAVMAGCGLLVPAAEGSHFTMLDGVFCDIGDGQNIAASLSTFSAHMKQVTGVLDQAGAGSLVLLDELGSGTDPAEGMGIAVAILEALKDIGCLILVTTHYPEVKEYAETTDGMINARMAFDKNSLKPLYQMVIGEAGESCALYIAEKLGFPETLLQIADSIAYGNAGITVAGIAAPGEAPFETGYKSEEQQQRKKKAKKKTAQPAKRQFTIGDSVSVPPDGKKGIVSAPVNERGNVQVQVQRVKKWYPANRVKLLVSAAEMYPEDYDFSIIFDTPENRRARHVMERKYEPDATIVYEER